MNSIEGAIVHVCGKVDPELVGELGVLIMDKIGIVDDTPCYEEVWRRRVTRHYTHMSRSIMLSHMLMVLSMTLTPDMRLLTDAKKEAS